MQTTETGLRADVARLVHNLVAHDWHLPDPDCWRAHSFAKDAISRLCGWDAPTELYDQEQYDLAIQRYVEGCGL